MIAASNWRSTQRVSTTVLAAAEPRGVDTGLCEAVAGDNFNAQPPTSWIHEGFASSLENGRRIDIFASQTVTTLFCSTPVDALKIFATLARVEIGHLERIQTPSAWMTDRAQLPYCFRCLVVNPVDVTAPRWKQRWLAPDIKVCEEHGNDLEHIPASMPRQAKNMDRLLSNIRKYRHRCSEASWYRRH